MYDLLYRFGAPWEGDPRSELVGLVESGRLNPSSMPRAIDLGCGSAANSVFLAEHGFDVTGVDFSPVALGKARALAAEHGPGFGMFFEQAAIDQRRQILAAFGGEFKTVLDRIG